MPLRRASPARGAAVLSVVLGGLLAAPVAAHAVPDQELPFACAEQWTGTTRDNHSPSPLAVDFNRANDAGRLALASAAGVVTRVEDTGPSSYGRWVRIDHTDGHASVYAHLSVHWVVPGQYVDQGAPIGRVGDTGGVSGAHLHYEQRQGRDVVRPYFGGSPFVYGSTTASGNCPDVPIAGDWDGDRSAEVAVFRRDAGGTFERYSADGTLAPIRLGRGFDLPVTGDWDGDGVTDVGVRRQGLRLFLLRRGDGTAQRIRMGMVRDLPVTGDWDGDGVTGVGVWRPSATRFRLLMPDATHQVVRLGSRGAQPLAADWDGDGVTDVGVYDSATATFTLRTAPAGGTVTLTTITLGSPGDLPVAGDWNGDGVADVGVWAPSTATYTLRMTPPAAPARGVSDPELRTLAFGRPR